jgi:osmotically-inducible protein OsmY
MEAMKSDSELRRDVERELEWEPGVDERRIGVSVIDGVVTLTGQVPSYAERWKAERTAERVPSVRGIANDLEVIPTGVSSDTDVARAAVDVLKWDITVRSDRIKVKVDKGWVTLTGDTTWGFQRRVAERALRNLTGVRGLTNLITVKPGVKPQNVKPMIEETFRRKAVLDANNIQESVNGSEVALRGTVRSWIERHEAEKAARAAPGVTAVHNYITVEEPAYAA